MEPREIFEKAYSILVEHAGAPDNADQVATFTGYYLDSRSNAEFRFCGLLGFGGKFWRNDQRYYISCYPEDRNTNRDRIIGKVNLLLSALPYYEPA